MSMVGLPAEAAELLKQYNIDIKDYGRARSRYTTVLRRELVPPPGEATTPEVMQATVQAQEELKAAWAAYTAACQDHFTRVTTSAINDIAIVNTILSGGTVEGDQGLTVDNAAAGAGAGPAPVASPGSDALETSRSVSVVFSANVPALTPLGRAHRMNELCAHLLRWYSGHESVFELPCVDELVQLVAVAIRSVSKLTRLLGLRIAALALGNAAFARGLLGSRENTHWIALYGDRQQYTEVELLLSLLERLMDLRAADAKAFPEIPYCWVIRVATLLRPSELLLKAPQKRRSQAVEVAVRMLRASTAKATAAGLHTLLMGACVTKGALAPEEVDTTVDALVRIFADPDTRMYIKLGDLSTLFVPFLETMPTAPPAEHLASLHCARAAIARLMATWVGNLWLACESKSLRALVDLLYLPGDVDRKMVIFNLFNQVLRRLAPHRGIEAMEPWMGVEEERRRREAAATAAAGSISPGASTSIDLRDSTSLSMGSMRRNYSSNALCDAMLGNGRALVPADKLNDAGGADDDDDGGDNEEYIPTTKALGYHLMEPLLGRVLVMLLHHGLPLALIGVLKLPGTAAAVLEATSSLLQSLFVLMDTVLPRETVGFLHSMLSRTVGQLSAAGDLYVGGLTSQLFHNYKKSKADHSLAAAEVGLTAPGSTAQLSITFGSAGSAIDLDEPTFQAMVRETRVELSPLDFKNWNFEVLLLLIQGPWRNPRRLRGSLPVVKKVLGFYTPRLPTSAFYMRPFCTLTREQTSSQMCLAGIELVDLLLTSREGAELLADVGFPEAIVKMLKEVRLGSPVILTKAVVTSRVGQSVLRTVGVFTACAKGLTLMRDYGVFDAINGLFSKLSGARLADSATDTIQDVCYQLVQYVHVGAVPNYGICEDLRYTLRQAIVNGSSSLRLCAVTQLRKTLWRDLSTSMKWGVETLVQALHDDFYSVVECAFRLLLSICLCSDDGLDYLISLVPNVLMESEVILQHAKQLGLSALLYLITRRPAGFRFLQCYGWIEQELTRWETEEHSNFCVALSQLQNSGAVAGSALKHFMQNSLAVALAGSSGGSGNINGSMRGSFNNQSRHGRSISDGRFSSKSSHGPGSAVFSPVTVSAISSADFFPIHFASVLCSSPEGMTLFKHSRLWQRSVEVVSQQPLPPEVVYEKSLSDEDGDDPDGSDDDYKLADGPSERRRRNLMQERAEEALTPHQLQQLKRGCLNYQKAAEENTVYSAARGYLGPPGGYVMNCSGDRWTLQEALLCIAHAGTSETGFGLVLTIPNILQRLTALARFGANLDVRSIALLSSSLLTRSRRGAEAYRAHGYCVISNPNAYTGVDGVPYAVSFAHMRLTKIMSLSKRFMNTNTSVRSSLAGADLSFDSSANCVVSRRQQKAMVDALLALANPVSKEASKKMLYNTMKRSPETFLEPRVVRLFLEAANVLQMGTDERKFIADLLENAQLVPPNGAAAGAAAAGAQSAQRMLPGVTIRY